MALALAVHDLLGEAGKGGFSVLCQQVKLFRVRAEELDVLSQRS